MQILTNGAIVCGKSEKEEKKDGKPTGVMLQYLDLDGIGFKDKVLVPPTFYDRYNAGDIIQFAFRPVIKKIASKINDSIKALFVARITGMKLVDKNNLVSLQNWFEKPSIEVAVESKKANTMPKTDKDGNVVKDENGVDQVINWYQLGLTGAMSGDITVKEDVYNMVEEYKKYKMTIGFEIKEGNFVLYGQNFEYLGDIETGDFEMFNMEGEVELTGSVPVEAGV